jgi:energy-coupling factor transporter transmembrane protein EcfT
MSAFDTFTIVTGLASLFGFAIQVFDLFPKLGNIRQRVFLFLLGIFVGSLLRAIAPGSISFNVEINGFTLLVGLLATVIGSCVVAAGLTSDRLKRSELFAVSGFGTLIFVAVLFFGLMTYSPSAEEARVAVEKQRLTVRELSSLADQAIQAKDYERAVMHLNALQLRLQTDDLRKKLIGDRIHTLELEAIK